MSPAELMILAVAVPAIGAVLIALTGSRPNVREAVTLVTSALLAACVYSLLPTVLAGERPSVELRQMLPGLNIRLELEPLGMVFAGIASLLWPITSLYSIGYMCGNNEKNQTRFYLCFAIALSSAVGVALAGNLLTLFIFYEILSLSTYPLVAHKGDDNARLGGRTYIAILLLTSIGLMLPAIIWTYVATGTLEFAPGGILNGHITVAAGALLLFLYVFGIGKAAVMPVHRWLPAAMVAPTPVSALLHAVAVVKAGVFCVTKVVIYTFGVDFLATIPAHTVALYVAGFTVVAASAIALRQTNLKRLLAYSTISQLSYIVLAALILTPLSEIGATLHIVAHAFGKITLFFTAGAIYVASKKTEVTQLRGIGHHMPFTMTAFTIGALSMIGVPPTAGFISKWYILGGAFQADSYFVLGVLILSTVLNAAYFLPIVFRAFFYQDEAAGAQSHGEAPTTMVVALSLTATLTLLFFFFNAPVIALAESLVGGGS